MRNLIALVLSAGILALAGQAAAQEAQVGIDGGNDAFLYGSLLRPEGTAPAPFVVIVPGSGPTDRDGNSASPVVKANTYKLLAEALAARGIGSLRADKRGVGASTAAGGKEDELTLDTYVDDTVNWAKFLALQPRVKCVVLLGHSEGALIAALAGHKVKTCGVIEVAGAGRPAGDLIADQLKEAMTAGQISSDLYSQSLRILSELRAKRPVPVVPLTLASLFRPGLQPYLMSWLNRDPVEAGKGLSPLLIVQGDHDLQVSPDDAQRLANGATGSKLAILPGVNHVLKSAPAEREANIATYADPDLPLAPGVVPAIADFILGKR